MLSLHGNGFLEQRNSHFQGKCNLPPISRLERDVSCHFYHQLISGSWTAQSSEQLILLLYWHQPSVIFPANLIRKFDFLFFKGRNVLIVLSSFHHFLRKAVFPILWNLLPYSFVTFSILTPAGRFPYRWKRRRTGTSEKFISGGINLRISGILRCCYPVQPNNRSNHCRIPQQCSLPCKKTKSARIWTAARSKTMFQEPVKHCFLRWNGNPAQNAAIVPNCTRQARSPFTAHCTFSPSGSDMESMMNLTREHKTVNSNEKQETFHHCVFWQKKRFSKKSWIIPLQRPVQRFPSQ